MYRILFLGTPDFAVPSLRALAADDRFEIVGVVTRPDKPVGRDGTITAPPVKLSALKLGITNIRQPQTLNDEAFKSWIEEIGPTCDAFVVVAYGKIFRDWFLNLPKHGLINVHASLLPRWRGASPINAAIASGDAMTGVSIMKIVREMDAGPVLAMADESILPDDTAATLHDRLSMLGAVLLPNTLANYLDGHVELQPQDESKATFCKTLTREDGKIDWTKSADEIERLLRAYTPWPGLWTEVDGKRLKVIETKTAEQWSNGAMNPESHIIIDGYPAVVCGNKTALILKRIQPEGKGVMDGTSYLAGNRSWE